MANPEWENYSPNNPEGMISVLNQKLMEAEAQNEKLASELLDLQIKYDKLLNDASGYKMTAEYKDQKLHEALMEVQSWKEEFRRRSL